MKVVGLTGGIGSGKTTIAHIFEKELSVPVYFTDYWAKQILNQDQLVKHQIINLLGQNSYIEGVYNTKYISEIVFSDQQKLQQLNEIVHPAVRHHFERWKQQQNSPYIIIESAILFESKLHHICDAIIVVVAPLQERINRVMLRDGVDAEAVLSRIKNQWTDQQRIEKSNFVIENDIIRKNLDKVKRIHFDLLKTMNIV